MRARGGGPTKGNAIGKYFLIGTRERDEPAPRCVRLVADRAVGGISPVGGMAAASHSRYSAIDGMVRSTNVTHEAMLRREAVEYLHGIHRAQCVLGATPLIFVMWECTGLGGDLTSLARALVIAASQRRQVIVLPPNRAARAVCRLPPNISTSMRQPWHWLSGDGGSVRERAPLAWRLGRLGGVARHLSLSP